jgi:hypothetical protein
MERSISSLHIDIWLWIVFQLQSSQIEVFNYDSGYNFLVEYVYYYDYYIYYELDINIANN